MAKTKLPDVITVCLLSETGGMTFPKIQNTLDPLISLVGDYVTPLQLPSAVSHHLLGLCGENGLQRFEHEKVKVNPYSKYLSDTIFGPVVIVATEGPDFISLTEEDIDLLGNFFPYSIAPLFQIP